MKDICIGLYNMAIKVVCDKDSSIKTGSCMCPDKTSFEYMCYLQAKRMAHNPRSGAYRYLIQKSTGEMIIHPEIQGLELCIPPHVSSATAVKIIEDKPEDKLRDIEKWSADNIAFLIYLVNMLQTKVVLYPEYELSLQQFMAAYDTERLMENFWNFIYIWLESVQHGKDSDEILGVLVALVEDLKHVFEQREDICAQQNTYSKKTIRAMEAKEVKFDRTKVLGELKVMQKRTRAENMEEFLFWEGEGTMHAYKEVLDEILFVFKAYLEQYATYKETPTENEEKLLAYLEEMQLEERNIKSIKGLGHLTLGHQVALKGDAGLIMKYLETIRRQNQIVSYIRVA